jgi:toxin ParE1/3/4
MLSLNRSAQAEQDLIEIWCYIATDNRRAANALVRTIDEKCHRLAHFPGMGQARPDIAEGIQHFPVGSYLVLYRTTAEAVEIVRVVHAARGHFSL